MAPDKDWIKQHKDFLFTIAIVFSLAMVAIFYFRNNPETARQSALKLSFEKGETNYQNRKFSKAAHHFHNFIEIAEKTPHEDSRVIKAIDRLGRIYLSIKHQPKIAESLLNRFVDHPGLNRAENEELHEWIAVAQQRSLIKDIPNKIKNPDLLFSIGKQHFDQAFEDKSIKSSTAQRHFEIAESYFLKLIEGFENHKNIAEVYFMIGVIEKNILTQEKWTEHFYLKEAIRKAPHTPTALKAYQFLYKEIHKENTKADKDNTPQSIEKALKELKKLAQPKQTSDSR